MLTLSGSIWEVGSFSLLLSEWMLQLFHDERTIYRLVYFSIFLLLLPFGC